VPRDEECRHSVDFGTRLMNDLWLVVFLLCLLILGGSLIAIALGGSLIEIAFRHPKWAMGASAMGLVVGFILVSADMGGTAMPEMCRDANAIPLILPQRN
jgi:hypothetical protein